MSISPEDPISIPQVREFDIDLVHIKQQGRIIELNHPQFGQTYLIDVTDQEDISDREAGEQGDVIREMLGKELFNPRFYESYSRNNGTVAVISRKLSVDQKPRIYLGQDIIYNEEGNPDLTSTLVGLKMNSLGYYVPMSIEPESFMLQVIKAEREVGEASSFKGIYKKFIPVDPNSDEFYEKGEYPK